jgi:hypothetical protein
LSDLEQRFRSKFIVDENGCWIWQAGKRDGYGRYHFNDQWIQAHRYAYEKLRDKVPDGMLLDHLCRNRPCVNPDHLEVVTLQENINRGQSPFILNKRKTHCKHGHEFNKENTAIGKNGYRKCIPCHRRRALEHMHNKKLGKTKVHNSFRTHCKNGHEYSEDNTKLNKSGTRICRTCYKNSLKHGEKQCS